MPNDSDILEPKLHVPINLRDQGSSDAMSCMQCEQLCFTTCHEKSGVSPMFKCFGRTRNIQLSLMPKTEDS